MGIPVCDSFPVATLLSPYSNYLQLNLTNLKKDLYRQVVIGVYPPISYTFVHYQIDLRPPCTRRCISVTPPCIYVLEGTPLQAERFQLIHLVKWCHLLSLLFSADGKYSECTAETIHSHGQVSY